MIQLLFWPTIGLLVLTIALLYWASPEFFKWAISMIKLTKWC